MKIYETFEDQNKYYLVLEMMNGSRLNDYLDKQPPKNYTEKFIANIMKQLLTALSHCHSIGLAHRDIRPENLIFADSENKVLKLINFGFAKMFENTSTKFTEILGSPLYMSPEVVERKPYDLKCDIWSAGIMLYLLLTGDLPYNICDDTLPSLFALIKKSSFDKSYFTGGKWDSVSEEAKDFIIQMLKKNPTERATANSLLEHPWLTKAPNIPASPEDCKKAFDCLKEITVDFSLQ